MSLEDNKQIVERAFGAMIARDLRPLQELLAPDARLHQCGFLEPIPGRAILSGEFPNWRLIDDRQVRLETIVGEGDMVAIHWWTSGRYSDPGDPERKGRLVSFPSMTFIRLEAGKVAEIWNIQDTSTMQTQLSQTPE